MRIKILALVMALSALGKFCAFAEAEESQNSPLSFYTVTDFAYYPETDYKSGGTHFSGVDGIYDKIECRITGFAEYKIPTPLGEHWLVKNSNIVLCGGLELTPVSLRPMMSLRFTPVPFAALSTGSSVGIAWNQGDLNGMKKLDDSSMELKSLSFTEHVYYDFWGKGTLMFDTGEIIKGDWTHIVLLAEFQLIYKGLSGISDGTVWTWQTENNLANGWQYELSCIVGYQMPLALRMAGVMANCHAHLDSDDYGKYSSPGKYDGDFVYSNISGFFEIDFGKKDFAYFLVGFSSRQSFREDHDDSELEPYLTSCGTEWFFNRIAVSWTHRF
ncbi:hypothetical protein [Treponema sp.]|uniref:hypothetical protein n=1 Tax=Treponema sp. TaxID=166 RepID=UPI003F01B262